MTAPIFRPTCRCLGCITFSGCEDNPCQHGCGGTASTPWGTCQPCEDDLTGAGEGDYDDQDY